MLWRGGGRFSSVGRMPRQLPSLVSDRLLSLVASGAGRGSGDDVVERLEGGWVPVEPGSIDLAGLAGDEEEAEQEVEEELDPVGAPPRSPGGLPRVPRVPREPRAPGRHRDPRGRRGPAVVTLPVSLRGARVDVSWVGIIALVTVLAVAAFVFAVRVARAEGGAAPVPVAGSTPLGVVRSTTPTAFVTAGGSAAASGGVPSGAAPGGKAGAGSGASGAAASATIVVHVVGQVAHPGVVALPAGSRIGEAMTRAGGPLPGADVARLNLAQFLSDGEQVYVPRPGEDPPAPIGGGGGSAVRAAGGAPAVGGSAGGTGIAALVDINAADLAGLDRLPGVGPVLAQRILDWRGQHGRFSAVDELGEVSGIGDKLLEQLRPLVRV